MPDSRLVRQTSNSAVAGLPMATAPAPSSGRRRWPKFSAREHSAHVNTCGPLAGPPQRAPNTQYCSRRHCSFGPVLLGSQRLKVAWCSCLPAAA